MSEKFELSANKIGSRKDAIAKLDAWLTAQALAQNNNCTSAAAKKLGVSCIWMNKLRKRYQGTNTSALQTN